MRLRNTIIRSLFLSALACLSFTAQASAQSAQSISKELNRLCFEVPDGIECIKAIKDATKLLNQRHQSQFLSGGSVAKADPQYSGFAASIIRDACKPINQISSYDMDTMERRRFMVMDMTSKIDICVRAVMATKEKDTTGAVQLNEDVAFVVQYYNTCYRGMIDEAAQAQCTSLSRSLRK
tara:strand:- start:435 stop:974 length:540 start_codon:yes stop_codon:yes gene_type:complete